MIYKSSILHVYMNEKSTYFQSRFSSRIKDLAEMKLPSPKNTDRQCRLGFFVFGRKIEFRQKVCQNSRNMSRVQGFAHIWIFNRKEYNRENN